MNRHSSLGLSALEARFSRMVLWRLCVQSPSGLMQMAIVLAAVRDVLLKECYSKREILSTLKYTKLNVLYSNPATKSFIRHRICDKVMTWFRSIYTYIPCLIGILSSTMLLGSTYADTHVRCFLDYTIFRNLSIKKRKMPLMHLSMLPLPTCHA